MTSSADIAAARMNAASHAQATRPSRLPNPKPSMTVTREGALICQIGSKTYKITHLERMLPGSTQWQAIDMRDLTTVTGLDALALSIEKLVKHIGPEQFDLRGAKSFQILATRKVSEGKKGMPFSFHEFVWKPPGAEKDVHFRVKLENFESSVHGLLEASMNTVGKHFADALQNAKATTPAKKKSDIFNDPEYQGFITKVEGRGNCLPLAIAHQLVREASEQEKQELRERYRRNQDKKVETDNELMDEMAKQLRQFGARQIEQDPKFRDADHIGAIKLAVNDAYASAQKTGFHLDKIAAAHKAQNPDGDGIGLMIDAYTDYIKENGVYLDSPSLEALADVLGRPIVLIVRNSDHSLIIRDVYNPAAPNAPKGVEHPRALFVYFDGTKTTKTTGSKHYDPIAPEHAVTKSLIQHHKLQLMYNLGQEFAAELRVSPDKRHQEPADINRLKDPISRLRMYFPELIPHIHRYLIQNHIPAFPDNDENLVQALLMAKDQGVDFNTLMQGLFMPGTQ